MAGFLDLAHSEDGNGSDASIEETTQRLQSVIDAAAQLSHAAKEIEEWENAKVRPGRGGSRHETHRLEDHAFRDLAATYRELTGKWPGASKSADKASGPFIDFCQAVFSELGLLTTPEAISQRLRRFNKPVSSTNQSAN